MHDHLGSAGVGAGCVGGGSVEGGCEPAGAGPDPRDTLGTADIALRYVLAVAPMLFYGATWMAVVSRNPDRLPRALLDAGLGLGGLVLMRWRRRWPWPIALAATALTLSSDTATGPAQVAYVSLVTHRRWKPIVSVAALFLVCLGVRATWYGVGQAAVVSGIVGVLVLAGLTAFGLYLRAQRDLEVSRREAEAVARLADQRRIEQARMSERMRIAHEMHDVLAHRISLLAMLAGGLAYRTDLGAEEIRGIASAIQENAHQSLNELRGVLGTLRRDPGRPEGSGDPAVPLKAPQPTLDDLVALFDEVRAAGQTIEVRDTVSDRELLPAGTGRHAYRIVQEALTNARKHAPGTPALVEVEGAPGKGLRLRVRNAVPPGAESGPGSRLGLVGLAERTRMAGGTLSHVLREGSFNLEAWLPWETAPRDATGDRG